MSDTIDVNGETYVGQAVAGDPPPVRIIVADRGWVFIGHATEDDRGIALTDAKCIRVWGTDSDRPGLGWLAANGPTEKTKLDPSGTVRIPAHSVIASFDVNAEAWA